ncbi:hypothetical protein [Oscillibacter sp.]|uniref:hypothetical protein n=1 Tax=Oscillibacter sp. TaxID=1945593 RepID=UPI0028B0A8E1|nr:hypothetical protein [Oscillibacter sp.]
MTAKAYKDIINGFDVEHNSTYLPHGGNTYCNIFAQDVAEACGTPLPTGGCTAMRNALAHNQFPKWYSVTFDQAQSRANDGVPGIAITYDHIAIIRPNDGSVPATKGKVHIAQAGATCYNDTTLSYGWKSARWDEIRFYSWYEVGKPSY